MLYNIFVRFIVKNNTSPEAVLGIMPNIGLFFGSPCVDLDFSKSLCNRSINCSNSCVTIIIILYYNNNSFFKPL